jgi:F0F1-type ATP synthase assembly protein I
MSPSRNSTLDRTERFDPTPTPPTSSYYKYNGEGESFKSKTSAASASFQSSASSIKSAVLVGLGFVVAGVVGFIAGMHTVRRRQSSSAAEREREDNVEMGETDSSYDAMS